MRRAFIPIFRKARPILIVCWHLVQSDCTCIYPARYFSIPNRFQEISQVIPISCYINNSFELSSEPFFSTEFIGENKKIIRRINMIDARFITPDLLEEEFRFLTEVHADFAIVPGIATNDKAKLSKTWMHLKKIHFFNKRDEKDETVEEIQEEAQELFPELETIGISDYDDKVDGMALIRLYQTFKLYAPKLKYLELANSANALSLNAPLSRNEWIYLLSNCNAITNITLTVNNAFIDLVKKDRLYLTGVLQFHFNQDSHFSGQDLALLMQLYPDASFYLGDTKTELNFLGCDNIPYPQLINLLKTNTQIKKITLGKMDFSKELSFDDQRQFFSQLQQLLQLESVDFGENRIFEKHLHRLLSKFLKNKTVILYHQFSSINCTGGALVDDLMIDEPLLKHAGALTELGVWQGKIKFFLQTIENSLTELQRTRITRCYFRNCAYDDPISTEQLTKIFAWFPSLSRISIRFTDFSNLDWSLPDKKSYSEIEIFEMPSRGESINGVFHFANNNPALKKLKFSWASSEKISYRFDSDFLLLFSNCPQLEYIGFIGIRTLDCRYCPLEERHLMALLNSMSSGYETLQLNSPDLLLALIDDNISLPETFCFTLDFGDAELSREQMEKIMAAMPKVIISGKNLPLYYPNVTSTRTVRTVDADTSLNKNKKFDLTRVFFKINATSGHPDPANYRLYLYLELTLNLASNDPQSVFSMMPTENLSLKPCAIQFHDQDVYRVAQEKQNTQNIFYAKTNITLSTNWRPLPSLFSTERITDMHFSVSDKNIVVQYSESENIYYIRQVSGMPTKIEVDYLIEVNPQKQNAFQAVKKLVKFFNEFGAGELDKRKLGENFPARDYVIAMLQQKVGACRHRAALFKAIIDDLALKNSITELKKLNFDGIEARIVANDCHSFVEVKESDVWIAYDLGGHPAAG